MFSMFLSIRDMVSPGAMRVIGWYEGSSVLIERTNNAMQRFRWITRPACTHRFDVPLQRNNSNHQSATEIGTDYTETWTV